MRVRYPRPPPAAIAAARLRLQRLSGGSEEVIAASSPMPPQVVVTATSLPLADAVPPAPMAAGPLASFPSGPVPGPPEPVRESPVPGPPEPSIRRRLAALATGWAARLVPAALRGARLDPGWRGVAAVAVIAVLAAALAGFVAWRARPHAVAVSAPPVIRAGASAVPSSGPSVVVAVAGGVRRPGLVTLPAGSRVADALRAAGGVLPGVDVGLLNLARRLVDGEQVVVGASAQSAPGSAAATGTVNLNTATVEQLDALPGVGPVLAARIASYRTQHGGFRSVDQLREVSGIGEAKFTDLRPLVSV